MSRKRKVEQDNEDDSAEQHKSARTAVCGSSATSLFTDDDEVGSFDIPLPLASWAAATPIRAPITPRAHMLNAVGTHLPVRSLADLVFAFLKRAPLAGTDVIQASGTSRRIELAASFCGARPSGVARECFCLLGRIDATNIGLQP